MKRAVTFRRRLTLAGLLLIGLLIGTFWLAFKSIQRTNSLNALVIHTQEVLQNAEALRLYRASLRSSYWAFFSTRNPEYRNAFYEKRRELNQTLSHLRALTSDNRQQQEILDRLEPAFTEEADKLQAILERQPLNISPNKPPATAVPLIVPAADDMRAMIERFEDHERTLFHERSLAAQQSSHRVETLWLAAGILTLCILLAAGHLIQREIMKRAIVEVGLRHAQEILGVRLEEQRTELGHAVEDLHAQIRARKASDEELRKLNEELETRVQNRTAELQDLNRELEAFTYSVSHDLRAPLRHMDGFSRILQEEFAPQLPDEAKHYVDRIRYAASNMSNLVEDLLHLSRVGRQLPRRHRASLLALAEEAKNQILPEADGREVCWTFHDLPDVEADPVLLRQVFANLLSNSVKFTRKQSSPEIEVGAKRENGKVVIFVKDNGAGFDPRYADKLFGVFQRLHRQDEYEGTGIGLATVQRIVHKHGGKVWAESQPGQGATFFFSLPLSGETTLKIAEEIGASV